MWPFGNKHDVDELIARKNYRKAIKVLEQKLSQDPDDTHARKQLVDVCVRAGDDERAIELLYGLAEEHAAEGFLTKSVAILKRIQRIDPDRQDVKDRLEALREKTQSSSDIPLVRAHVPSEVAAESPEDPSPPAEPASSRPPEPGTRPPTDTSHDIVLSEGWLQEATEEEIDRSPFLYGLSRPELMAVSSGLTLLVKNPGAIIFAEGEPADRFYVLASGFARIYQRVDEARLEQVRVIRGGDVLGQEAVLGEASREHTVTAASECELLELDQDTFARIVHEHPGVLERLMEVSRWRG